MTAEEQNRSSGLTPVRYSRLSQRGLLLGLSLSQIITLAIGLLTLVTGLYLSGGTGLILTSPVWIVSIALCWVPVTGRPLVAWLPIAAHWAARGIARQTVYRRRIVRPRPAGTLALPGDAAALRHYVDPESGAAMVHDPHAATLTVMTEISHPSFTLLDPSDQHRRVTGWGRVLASCCRSDRIARVQVLERAIPDSGSGLAQWWADHGLQDDSWVSRTYQDLVQRAGPSGERHITTLSLALDMHKASRAVRQAGGGVRGAAQVLRHEMHTVNTLLRSADLQPAGWYGPDQLAVVLRTAYDPAIAATLERSGAFGGELASAGPVAVDEWWDRLRSDSAHHVVLWISQWPQNLVYPGFLFPVILSSGVRRAVSLVYEPVPTDRASRAIRKAKTEHVADAAQRARLGQIEDAAMSAEYRDVLQQESELTAGHGVLHYTGLIAITAPTEDQLETAVAEIEQAAIQANCETRRLVGQQAQAFTSAALPLCRGL